MRCFTLVKLIQRERGLSVRCNDSLVVSLRRANLSFSQAFSRKLILFRRVNIRNGFKFCLVKDTSSPTGTSPLVYPVPPISEGISPSKPLETLSETSSIRRPPGRPSLWMFVVVSAFLISRRTSRRNCLPTSNPSESLSVRFVPSLS